MQTIVEDAVDASEAGACTVTKQVERTLAGTGVSRLRHLRVRITPTHVILGGRVDTYYQKCLAQTVAAQSSDGRLIQNECEVL